MPGDPGFFREYAAVPADTLLPLPERLSMEEATLFEPLAVVLHSMQFVSLSIGETAAVFGAGPIGLLTIAVLKLNGASRIFAVDPIAHRRDLALALGATAAIDPHQVNPAQAILAETRSRGVDVAIDCAAKDNTMNHCLRAVRNAGRVVLTGIPSEVEVPVEFHVMRRKEIAIFNVRRSNHESELAFRLLENKPRRYTPMLTHKLPLDAVPKAFAMLERYEDGVGKIVIA
jgi:L-iditol 2-dehydrogenase